jgi:flagellar FliL protein
MQTYLRELRVEDLEGSEGLLRLREELLKRIQATADGADIKDVLFAEMILQ